ncbi:hypothetical protein [Salinisphaera sp.]|uniref:hypothetical protein n=1 Tax=Salinisphaera sp. TaxID=1914330 RepID=UPI002D77B3F0|nr:hypothetical protein [Salinisphaera sp.]HET7313989.1 hypothetical protein [Salinisphaera sp.]
MAQCETCGNDYEHAFEVTQNGKTHTFDTFQCAIHGMAPACPACGCKVIGQGVHHGDRVYCCNHCAEHAA